MIDIRAEVETKVKGIAITEINRMIQRIRDVDSFNFRITLSAKEYQSLVFDDFLAFKD